MARGLLLERMAYLQMFKDDCVFNWLYLDIPDKRLYRSSFSSYYYGNFLVPFSKVSIETAAFSLVTAAHK